jgi:putative IMPACT (imprinted ancient) family translation regulator
MAMKRANPSLSDEVTHVFASGTIEDRQSTFIAHFSPTVAVKTIQASPDFKSASHRIAAWRKASTQRTLSGGKQIFSIGSDDDGEKYAGKRLERVLDELKVEGAIVVARWYGGVLLGPVRFTHIENVAKEAIAAWKESTGEGSAKRQKTNETKVDDAAERRRLTKQLTERDQSIIVLRQLLTEKLSVESAENKDGQGSSQPSSTPAQVPNYDEMSTQRLRQLDKARDATISWILKQIDQVEAKDESRKTSVASDAAAS